MAKQMLTQEYVKSLFDYNPETGIFLWKVKKSQNTKIGIEAGTKNKYGYRGFMIGGSSLFMRDLVFNYIYLSLKKKDEHINNIGGICLALVAPTRPSCSSFNTSPSSRPR